MANLKKLKQGYGYKYTELSQINDALEEAGIEYYQCTQTEDGIDYIYTVPIIDGKELTARRGCRVVQPGSNKNAAQEQGSAITYARRYSLLMAFGFATEDDDAASVTAKSNDPKKATPAQIKKIEEIVEDKQGMLDFYKVSSVDELTMTQASNIIEKLGGSK